MSAAENITSSEENEENELVIDIGGWPKVSGLKVSLYLDPERPRVYSFWVIGSGWPEAAHNNRHLGLGSVAPSASPESLSEWLREKADDLREIADGYLGTEWDGSNHRGHWSDEAHSAAAQFAEELVEAVSDGDIGSYTDAGDYFSPAEQDVVDNVLEHDTLEHAAEAEVDEASAQGMLLDADDVEKTLRRLLERVLDEEWSPDEGDHPSDRVYGAARLLGRLDDVVPPVDVDDLAFVVPPKCQGQMVTRAYASDERYLYLRITDASARPRLANRLFRAAWEDIGEPTLEPWNREPDVDEDEWRPCRAV